MLTSALSAFAALVSQRIALADREVRLTNDPGPGLVGRSEGFREILLHASRAARCDLPVLIQGESGTGKEAVARQIHEAGSRRHGPFVAINCAAMPEGLMERELFGCVRGAFTGADRDSPGLFRAARGGSLLLDEIGDMPRSMQAKLLRTLQERRVRPLGGSKEIDVDVRLLAASHRHLEGLVSAGNFRADLFFRLAVLRIRIPPLRDRIDDLSVLIPVLAARLSRQAGVPHVRLTDAAVQRLREHRWPGNVRELEAVLARAALRTGGGPVGTEDLEIESHAGFAPVSEGDGEPLEAAMIRAALARCGGSVPRAAGRIGWTRQKLHRRMHALGLRASGDAVGSESGEPGVPA
jgi:DNA-binding NtrC family response regulator